MMEFKKERRKEVIVEKSTTLFYKQAFGNYNLEHWRTKDEGVGTDI